MSNLLINPQPQYEEKKEKIISETSIKIDEKKVMSKLLKIIKENKKLEETYRQEK